jgi:hypothetical protein
MKPETIARLRRELSRLPDDSLTEFFAVVLHELKKRRPDLDWPPKSPRRGKFKDCDPIRGY